MSDNRTAPLKSLAEIQINSTGTIVNIGLNEKSHPTVLFTTGQCQTQVVDETVVFDESWDVVKNVIGSSLLREGFEQHVLDLSVFIAGGLKKALNEKGYN